MKLSPRRLALWAGLLPILAVNTAYLVNMLLGAETCFPYLEGCHSVSRGLRSGPGDDEQRAPAWENLGKDEGTLQLEGLGGTGCRDRHRRAASGVDAEEALVQLIGEVDGAILGPGTPEVVFDRADRLRDTGRQRRLA